MAAMAETNPEDDDDSFFPVMPGQVAYRIRSQGRSATIADE
jgi:hypothetical protein